MDDKRITEELRRVLDQGPPQRLDLDRSVERDISRRGALKIVAKATLAIAAVVAIGLMLTFVHRLLSQVSPPEGLFAGAAMYVPLIALGGLALLGLKFVLGAIIRF